MSEEPHVLGRSTLYGGCVSDSTMICPCWTVPVQSRTSNESTVSYTCEDTSPAFFVIAYPSLNILSVESLTMMYHPISFWQSAELPSEHRPFRGSACEARISIFEELLWNSQPRCRHRCHVTALCVSQLTEPKTATHKTIR